MPSERKTVTFEMDRDEYEDMMEFVEDSLVFDNQSQFLRASVRTYLHGDDSEGEFADAQ